MAITVGKAELVYYDVIDVDFIWQPRIFKVLHEGVWLLLRMWIGQLTKCPIPCGHPWKKRFQSSLHLKYHWDHLDNDSYGTLADCHSCTVHGVGICHQKQLPLVPGTPSIDTMSIGSLGSFSKTKFGRQPISLSSDAHAILKQALTATTESMASTGTYIVNSWVRVRMYSDKCND